MCLRGSYLSNLYVDISTKLSGGNKVVRGIKIIFPYGLNVNWAINGFIDTS